MRAALVILLPAAIVLLTVVTRVQHPDLSETRLLLDFWPRWLIALALGGLAVRVTRR